MTLYARSDIATVSIGGVGHTHRRPMRADGTPVRRWALDCSDCEPQLDDDNKWSKDKHNIPLTQSEEEEIKRLNEEANAALERERIAQAKALAEGVKAKHNEDQGSDDDPDDEPVNSDDDKAKGDGGKDEGDKNQGQRRLQVDYDRMSYPDLVRMCKELGLEHTGKKPELVRRLQEHDDEPVDE